jgi:hypothetical protein
MVVIVKKSWKREGEAWNDSSSFWSLGETTIRDTEHGYVGSVSPVMTSSRKSPGME